MNTRKLLLLACLVAPFSALAHHSPAAFDQTVFTVVEGTVTEFKWGNPHVYFGVETIGPGGTRYVQDVEAGPASQLLPRGVTRDLLRAGDRVTVRANPNRRGPGYVVLGVELTIADGSRFPLHARALLALGSGESVATSVEGTWVPQPQGYLGLGAAMRSWPLTDLAKVALAGNRMPATQAECIPPGPPALMVNSIAIMVAVDDDTVTFVIDGVQMPRIVHLDAEHPAGIEPTLLGHSVGRWENNALIVDTIAFSSHAEGMGFLFPSSDAKHTVERFSLSDDRRHLDYEITVEDSTYLAAPATYRTSWDYRPGQTPSSAVCDPATARRFLAE